jgi:hypothetical protein
MVIWHMPRVPGISAQAGDSFNSMVRSAAIPDWHGIALCMIAVNIADSRLAFACFGRLDADLR